MAQIIGVSPRNKTGNVEFARQRRPEPWPRWTSLPVPRSPENKETFIDGTRVRDMARQAGVHPVSLARSFRKHFGASVTERLKQLRVEAAARSLSGGNLPIAEVARQCGYADQSHLCRQFKLLTGLTPGRYRKLARQ